LKRLSQATLRQARPGVRLPKYDRSASRIGVVHLGPGAFHRAHQAYYLDLLLEQDPRWAEVAVSLRSAGARDALAPQDGLYALAEVEEQPALQVIGSIKAVLTAPEDPGAVFDHLASPEVRLWTLTITEKGYCLTPGGELDPGHPDIRADLASPRSPVSAIGYLTEGLRRRREAGLAPPAVVSCDNLTDNGVRLGRAVVQFADAVDPDLARWIEGETRFPRTMVDSITPATDGALRARVEAELGLADAWPVQRERFVQWVIEDCLPAGGPDLACVGVELTSDVAAYEQAKLRLLNGAHSTLAYVGLARGHETVADAMADAELAAFVRELMWTDIMPSLKAPPGLDLGAYAESLLRRFRNRAIRHQLSQIAWDGSQKLPFRLLGTIADALEAGRPVSRLAEPVAAWMKFIVQRSKQGVAIIDPLADQLTALGKAATGAPADAALFLTLESVFPDRLTSDPRFRAAVEAAYAA
jgi:fructuronate reductase